jgi:hypothetical protein
VRAKNAREAHKAAREAANIVGTEAAGAIEKLVAYTVSIDQRLKGLEPAVAHLETKARAVDHFRARPFWPRMRWLLTGR